MAKGNHFLGQARGSVGDVTFTRVAGVQVSRARNRSPKNPRTVDQQLQRTVMKTTSSAFSFLKAIADHSFEGQFGVTANQSRFASLNVAMLRSMPLVRELIAEGNEEDFLTSAAANFASRGSYGCELNPYVVSEGSLRSIGATFGPNGGVVAGMPLPSAGPSYADVAAALGLALGDQLTFLWLTVDDTEASSTGRCDGFFYARVILMPSSGDASVPFYAAGGDFWLVNEPHPRNEGHVYWDSSAAFIVSQFGMASGPVGNGSPLTPAACAVIVSRNVGGKWLRSSESLSLRDESAFVWDHYSDYLGTAISSWTGADTRSLLYLNQADPSRLSAAGTRLRWTAAPLPITVEQGVPVVLAQASDSNVSEAQVVAMGVQFKFASDSNWLQLRQSASGNYIDAAGESIGSWSLSGPELFVTITAAGDFQVADFRVTNP